MKETIPEPIADDSKRRRARFVLIFSEGPADLREQADHVEKIRRHVPDRDPLRFATRNAAQVARLQPPDREMFERLAVLSPIDVTGQRDRSVDAVADFIEIDEPLRVRIRKRPKKD